MKDLRRNVLVILLLVGILFVFPNTVHAATSIKTNKWYSGTISGGLTKEFSLKLPKKKCYLYYESSFKNCRLGIILGDNGYEDIPNLCLTPDDYKSIRLYAEGNSGIKKCKYKFRIRSFKYNPFEKESNNTKKKASRLLGGKLYLGYLEGIDKDWYVFTASKSGKYRISTQLIDANSGENLRFISYKGTKKYASGKITKPSTVFQGKLKKNQKVYVRLSPSLHSDVNYCIKASKT